MPEFLSWLWDQALKVYDWFGDSYDALREGAAHAWEWASTLAEQAYQRARSLILQTGDYLQQQIDWTLSYLYYLFSPLLVDVQALKDRVFNAVLTWTQTQIDYLTDLYNRAVTYVNDWVAYYWELTKAWIQARIDEVRRWIDDAYEWVLTIRDQLIALVQTGIATYAQPIYDFFSRLYALVWQFFDDPVKFILDLLWPKIVLYLSFAIAYAMGAAEDTLPPLPPWGKG